MNQSSLETLLRTLDRKTSDLEEVRTPDPLYALPTAREDVFRMRNVARSLTPSTGIYPLIVTGDDDRPWRELIEETWWEQAPFRAEHLTRLAMHWSSSLEPVRAQMYDLLRREVMRAVVDGRVPDSAKVAVEVDALLASVPGLDREPASAAGPGCEAPEPADLENLEHEVGLLLLDCTSPWEALIHARFPGYHLTAGVIEVARHAREWLQRWRAEPVLVAHGGIEFCVPTALDDAATVALVDSMEEIGLAGDGEGVVREALRSDLVSALSGQRQLKMWWWG